MIGSIDLKCEISPIISQAYMAARDICEYHYMTAPELDYRYVISRSGRFWEVQGGSGRFREVQGGSGRFPNYFPSLHGSPRYL